MEIWSMKQTNELRIEAFEMKDVRKILRVAYHGQQEKE